MNINKLILFGCFLLSIQVSAQEILTKEEALAIALENNFGIKIAYNNLEVAENNTSIYNRGALPIYSYLQRIFKLHVCQKIPITYLKL